MCGIGGYLSVSKSYGTSDLIEMGDIMVRRGPDSSDTWENHDGRIGFVHRRLAILDLTVSGAQPMTSNSGKLTMVFNGEIYNHLDLRKRLNDVRRINWRGSSDTESVIEHIDYFGLEQTLSVMTGMFAVAIYDSVENALYLARDRAGEKPLYYSQFNDGEVLFASDLRAIEKIVHNKPSISKPSLKLFMRHGFIPAPYTIFNKIYKLRPGHILRISDHEKKLLYSEKCYWKKPVNRPEKIRSFEDTKKELRNLIDNAVAGQLMSDVPIGAFLSGGIDSSLIVSRASKIYTSPVKTFTIGFEENGFNEAIHAKEIAKFLGTDHTEVYLKERDLIDVVPTLMDTYDEPFADSSQIPTYLVSQIARRDVTVALSGDAGDELFGGYNRYFLGAKLSKLINSIPVSLRPFLSSILIGSGRMNLFTFMNRLEFLFPSLKKIPNFNDKLIKLSELLNNSSQFELYKGLISIWKDVDSLVCAHSNLPDYALSSEHNFNASGDVFENRMMNTDFDLYLPDDILVKVDRAAMANSLETRVPFLDKHIVEFSTTVPLKFKMRDNKGKILLKEILADDIPSRFWDRPKQGFGVPLGDWLRGPLKEWALQLLDKHKMSQQGYLNADLVWDYWNKHLSRERDYHYYLWNVLMFQLWLSKRPYLQ